MTNGWTDIQNADVVLAMGGNPAENHPVGFRFVMEAKRNRNAKLVSVDPRFNRTSAVADSFTQIRAGSDIAFLAGLINYCFTHNRIQEDYVRLYTNATFIVHPDYAFKDDEGVFSGWDEANKKYDKASWNYDIGKDGFAKVDPTMQDPRCVYQLMKQFYTRYTPEMVSKICGCSVDSFNKAADIITSTYTPDKVGTIMYALGWTHHSFSVQLIHIAAMLQLLLGNIGMAGGGINALRGHSNIQGGTDCGMAYHNLPGYIAMPKQDEADLKTYFSHLLPKPLRPGVMNFVQNYDRFWVSQMKAYYGLKATKENDFGYAWHPRLPQGAAPGTYENWSWAYIFDHMYNGQMEGLLNFGMNPVNNGPHSRKVISALKKLKFLVVAENFETETASFWKPEIIALDEEEKTGTSDVKTEVFLLPAANFAEKDGSFVNSARWFQWKYKALDPPGDAKPDQEIIARIFLKVRDLYAKENGKAPEPVQNLSWGYTNPFAPSLDEVAKEINGYALADVMDEKDPKTVAVKAGEQLGKFLDARNDGTTVSGNWLYIGSYTQAGNMSQRRNNADPSGMKRFEQWGYNWPANRRVMYNRCSADAQGNPWDPKRPVLRWNGQKWIGDVPDYKPDSPPEAGMGPFIMLPEGVARLFVPGQFVEGPFTEFYEPTESPVDNQLHAKTSKNPAAKPFKGTWDRIGKPDEYPIVATTYRLTEHFHYWTKNNAYNVQLQPEFFVEVSEELAKEKNLKSGDMVKITSARGSIQGKAMVTKRIKPMQVAGKTVHQIGFPIHWGFLGRGAQAGSMANIVTPTVVDPNSFAPEYKGFLVKLEKV